MKTIHLLIISTLALFVISCEKTESRTVNDSFSLKIAAKTYNYCNNTWEDSKANISITSNGIEVITDTLNIGQNQLPIPLDYQVYELIVSKEGFESQTTTFNKEAIIAQSESELVLELAPKTHVGGVLLKTMEDYNNFAAKKYGRVDGFIAFSEIIELDNIEALSTLTSIGGGLRFFRANGLTSLNGLQNLKSISGDLYLGQNESLTTIAALEQLTCIGDYVSIQQNPELKNLKGLEKITELPDELRIDRNPKLADLNGLSNLENVMGNIYVGSNPLLNDLEAFSKIDTIQAGFEIEYNIGLTDMTGLDNLSTVNGDLVITANRIVNLNGLENLTEINGSLQIYNNSWLYGWCALQNLFVADGLNGFKLFGNCSFNPTVQDIIDGNCKP